MTVDAKPAPAAPKMKIDGVEYSTDQLSETARKQIVSLRTTEQEILRLEQQLAIFRTARNAYAQALKAELKVAKEASEATH
jgi:hypothetical protein